MTVANEMQENSTRACPTLEAMKLETGQSEKLRCGTAPLFLASLLLLQQAPT